VFRVGGVSSDATILKIAGGAFSIEGHVHFQDLGGDQLNKNVAEFVADEFQRYSTFYIKSIQITMR
jgi:molecular chaperone DnaK (HSP70)